MKQKEVFNKIGGIIKELNEQYEYLKGMGENLNDLELELFVSNAHFLADHIEILRKLNLQNSDKAANPSTSEKVNDKKYFEPLVQQVNDTVEEKEKVSNKEALEPDNTIINVQEEQPVPHVDLGSVAADDSYSYIRQEEPETIRHELILDESMAWDDDEDLPEEEKLPMPAKREKAEIPAAPKAEVITPTEPKPAPKVDKNLAGDVITPGNEDMLTINQKISSQLKEKSNNNPETAPAISDIKQAINLNDKMLYVKDLFNGYSLAYSEAIEILNRFSSFDEATRFLNSNYATKNNWESKPATTEKFYALLKRRYV